MLVLATGSVGVVGKFRTCVGRDLMARDMVKVRANRGPQPRIWL